MNAEHSDYSIVRNLWIFQSEVYELLSRVRGLIGTLTCQERFHSARSVPVEYADTMRELAAMLDRLRCKLIHDDVKRAAFDVLSTVPEFASETARLREDHNVLEATLDDVIELVPCSEMQHSATLQEIKTRLRQLPSKISSHLTSFIDLFRRAMLTRAFKVEPAGVP